MEKIVLNQISNPGISFTQDANDKIIALYDFTNMYKDKKSTYQIFQNDLINNRIFTGSYIRSFIPFLYNAGMINDYNNEIAYDNIFTQNGLLYIKIIKNLKDAINNNIDLPNLNAIKNDLLCISFDYMIKNKYKFYDKYLDILEFVKKYKTINREEFYILEYCIQNNYDCDEYISLFRDGNKEYDIYVISNDGEEINYRRNNAFNYFISFLSEEQCNYLRHLDQSNYTINYEREKFIDLVLNVKGEVK